MSLGGAVVQVQVEIGGLLELVWVTIDLDASCKIGEEAGKKKTSSACYPPEMVRPLQPPHAASVLLKSVSRRRGASSRPAALSTPHRPLG